MQAFIDAATERGLRLTDEPERRLFHFLHGAPAPASEAPAQPGFSLSGMAGCAAWRVAVPGTYATMRG